MIKKQTPKQFRVGPLFFYGVVAMNASVFNQFRVFNESFEGVVRYMYLDTKGLVTVGVGNLIDPLRLALELPFRYKNKPGVNSPGQIASKADIENEWRLIKGRQDLAQRGHHACEPLTNLELDDAAIDALVHKRLKQLESYLKNQEPFRNFDLWPADGQLGLLSMAWAMGPGFSQRWPKFSAACGMMDFDAAAENCRMREAGNPGLIPRNQANKKLFQNAAAVLTGEAEGFFQRESLYYPQYLL